MVKCKSQKGLVIVHKEALTTMSEKAEALEQQAEGLNVSHGAERCLKAQLRQVCYAKDRALGKSVLWTELCSPYQIHVLKL